MPFSFPTSPTLNQQSTQNGRVYVWDGATWVLATELAAHTHSGSDITSGTIPDARLSANVVRASSLSAYTGSPSGGLETAPRNVICFASAPLSSGWIYVGFFTPLVSATITQITMGSGTSGASGLTLARMGIYTFDETTATLVARTANDTTLFTAARTMYTRPLDSTGGFVSSYTLNAGTRYGVAVCCVGTTAPHIWTTGGPADIVGGLSPRLGALRTGQSDLLATIAASDMVAVSILYARLT